MKGKQKFTLILHILYVCLIMGRYDRKCKPLHPREPKKKKVKADPAFTFFFFFRRKSLAFSFLIPIMIE